MSRQEDPEHKQQKKSVRLFFALWPDETVRRLLTSRAKNIELDKKGRMMRSFNLHITLHFIGNTTEENMDCLDQQAATINNPPFILELNQLGSFNRQGIIWLGCQKVPSALHRLHRKLGQQIKQCDYEPDKRQYRPHVTLFRKAGLTEQSSPPEPVIWTIESFSLIRSESDREGVIYREIKRYPLSL